MGEFVRENLPDSVSFFEGEGLTLTGRGPWRTTECRFHGGSDSMRVNVKTGAWVCMACGEKGGDVLGYFMRHHDLEFIPAVVALGCWQDGPDNAHKPPPRPRTLSAGAAIGALAFESLLTAVAAGNLAQGVTLSEQDRARLAIAASRIQTIAGEFSQ